MGILLVSGGWLFSNLVRSKCVRYIATDMAWWMFVSFQVIIGIDGTVVGWRNEQTVINSIAVSQFWE